MGTSHLGTHKQRILSEGNPSYGAGYAVAQLGMSLPGAVAQLRMSFRNPEIDVCAMILEWGFPSAELTNKGGGPIRGEPSDSSYPIGDEPGSCPIRDKTFRMIVPQPGTRLEEILVDKFFQVSLKASALGGLVSLTVW